ncbi:acyltransferase family protein [Pseudomonas sp. DTU12.1]|uniref:acyltransferase family protein n=1 Tax=Pseudomonas sp. DTU12.1 TaxID=2654238 RepID=UPI00132E90FD|nr:acyltransferase family protein [Pseudomonas sp. DTU12.1]QHG23164.1 acyltransferase family protein [Pseudomonas sp. DTU12.1]
MIQGHNEEVKKTDSLASHLSYRPDIDGLRAFAIISVVLYHAFPAYMRGGFIGVDIFFVISGYLISSIIFKGLESGNFSFLDFYKRRVNRIFPALIIVLLACCAVGWFTLMAAEFKFLGKHVLGGIGFIQNLVLYKESGYFDTSSELKILLHLWSLGVEEQFYILFPLAAWVLWRRRVLVLPILICMALISFGAGLYKLSVSPSAAFYMPQYRFWEILSGSLLAYFSVFGKSVTGTAKGSLRFGNFLSVLGLVFLLASVVLIDKYKAFPGFWALMPVCGAVLMILAGPQAWLNSRLLASKPLVWIGLISYPLYLWHWPVITFIRIIGGDELNLVSGVFAVSASILLAYVTYRFLELPLRKISPRVPKASVLLAIGAALVVLGGVTYVKNGFIDRFGLPSSLKEREGFAQYYENALPGWAYSSKHGLFEKYRFECDFFDVNSYRAGNATMTPRQQIDASCYTPASNTKVMVWGDSHAQQFSYGLREALPQDISLLQVASSGCEANLPGRATGGRKYCDRSNEFALEVMRKEKPEVLVIAQLEGHDSVNNLKELTRVATESGVKKVIVVGPVPRFDQNLYQLVIRKYWSQTPRRISSNLLPVPFETDKLLTQQYSNGAGGFEYLSAISVLCNQEGCLTYLGDDRKTGLVTFDYGHLTPLASVYFSKNALGPLIVKKLIETGYSARSAN